MGPFLLALALLALTATSAAAQQPRGDPNCKLLPPGSSDQTEHAIQGTGFLASCGGDYHDFEIQLNISLGPNRDLARALVQYDAPDLYPGATVRPVSGLGEVAKDALVGSDTDPHWYMLHFAYGCYFVEVSSPSRTFNNKPPPKPVPLAEARRLAEQVFQQLAAQPQCPGEPAAAPKAPAAPPLGAPAAPAARPTEATKPAAPAGAPVPAAPAASPAAGPATATRPGGQSPVPAAIEATLSQPLTGQSAPTPPSSDDAKRGAAAGTVALGLSVVLNVFNRVIGLGFPQPPAGPTGGVVGLPSAVPPRGGPGQSGGAS